MTFGMVRIRNITVVKCRDIAAREYVCGGKRRRGFDTLQEQDLVKGGYDYNTMDTVLGM